MALGSFTNLDFGAAGDQRGGHLVEELPMSNPLDQAYREAGWGRITDAALSIPPTNVESQARDVARYAHSQIQRLTQENQRLREMGEAKR